MPGVNRFEDELERRGQPLAQPRPSANARNRFELELQRRVADAGAAAPVGAETEDDEPSGFNVFMNELFEGAVNSALAAPAGAVELMAAATPNTRLLRNMYEAIGRRSPVDVVVDAIPRPTGDQIVAGASAATAMLPGGRSPSQAYDEKLTELRDIDAAQREAHPVAAELGDVGGSIASIMIAKRPLRGAIRRTENAIVNAPVPVLSRAAQDAPGLSRAIDRALQSQVVRLPIRGTFRAAETGLEAAYLDVLQSAENDPVLAASLAAGGQAASSAALQGLKGMVSGGVSSAALKLSLAAMSTAGLWQMLKSASPGGRDRVLESIETGYDKVTFGVALGVLGGILGGRGRNSALAEDMPGIVEALTTTPRGAVLHYLTEMIGEDEETQAEFEGVLERMQADPEFRGENDFEREILLRFRQALEPIDGDTGSGPRRGVIDRSRTEPSARTIAAVSSRFDRQ